MAETRRKFGQDFKDGAVRIVRETGKPIAQVARELGINDGTLANWVSRDRRVREGGNGTLSESERAELIRLRKECAELAMERDVLKRSVALWSRKRCGITQSMGRTGSALDNAVAESFTSTLEFELLRGARFTTREQARHAVAAWIEEYNTVRRHSTNQMLSPVDYERAQATARCGRRDEAA